MTVQSERRTRRAPKLKWYIAGPLSGLICLPVLLGACAAMLSHELLPFELMGELVIACVFLSSAAAGICAARSRGGKALPSGLASGGVLAGMIVIVTLAVPGEGPLTAACLRHIIAALAGGAFGGALCLKRGKRRSRGRKR